jgi:hypothetical protein
MPTLVAFASLPFGLRGGEYPIKTLAGTVVAHVSERRYSPFLSITSRPELAQSIPPSGQGEGFTSYTWYDHPFVLRVIFGRNVASLGSINSCATIARPLPDTVSLTDEPTLIRLQEDLAETALLALNNLIAIVRHKARLYHVFDLRRDDIDITVRREDGALLREDPLQVALVKEEQAHTESFDLLPQSDAWYQELAVALGKVEPVSLGDDLLMEAERALAQRFPRQAIATCHTAIEAAASALLTRSMAKRGVSDEEVDQVLSTRSLIAKLDVLLQTYTSFSLKRHNPTLWKAFNLLNDLRNDVAHRGKRLTNQDAEAAIRTTRELLHWLDWVRGRNKLGNEHV